jgi:propionyl-CoA carboxylase alpha chain
VHPGYGFLAENEAFAAALEAAGITFIGPGAEAIRIMGDKIEAKKLAREAGVNTIPGHLGTVGDADEAVRLAEEIGYPVMIKATAGGGGKGMRLVGDAAEMREGYERAASEARSSFGDERLFVEKFIELPRHIEIQVLADGHGNVIHLGERECSIQRRHQKVIEEAPSPFLDEATRQAMGAQAVALARQVGYRSAGTVEFIVDSERRFYFLEMNTRLQVEHPVTELVTGIDLVEQMIRIAAGEKLALSQEEVTAEGWAIESRVYAEDPRRGFLPSVGRLKRYLPPPENAHLRIDAGVREGSEISVFYDPLIAKLCTFGASREEAIERMRGALDAFHIRGLSHNLSFLAAVTGHPRFRQGEFSTEFIDQAYPDGFHGADLEAAEQEALVAVAALIHGRHLAGASEGATAAGEWVVEGIGEGYRVEVAAAADGGLEVALEDRVLVVDGDWWPGDPLFRGRVDGRSLSVQVEVLAEGYRLAHKGADLAVTVRSPRVAELAALMPAKTVADTSNQVCSPMPGLVLSISVCEGQEIKAGETVAVIEAMKMENVLRAERDGTVARVLAAPGQSLVVDQVILEFA